ncbi:hypothetical protein [Paraliobacillus ryukyuensis]|uniref:hypothetical protein n=1 Tax=Paraliobacillus ryukyuensis TaxID=200904 RepID=UPI0015C47858|nr:hypothetical protein [Paraliobacillus ryukyuensis]
MDSLESVSFSPIGIIAFIVVVGFVFLIRVYKQRNLELKQENDKLKEALKYFDEKYNK